MEDCIAAQVRERRCIAEFLATIAVISAEDRYCTTRFTVVVCEAEPEVPVIVTAYVPAGVPVRGGVGALLLLQAG